MEPREPAQPTKDEGHNLFKGLLLSFYFLWDQRAFKRKKRHPKGHPAICKRALRQCALKSPAKRALGKEAKQRVL